MLNPIPFPPFAKGGEGGFFRNIPEAFKARDGEYLIIPLHQIFGSEELSAWAPAIQERTPHPSLSLNPEDAAKLGLLKGEKARLSLSGMVSHFMVTLSPSLPSGLGGISAGLPGLPYISLPAWGKIEKATDKG